MIRGIIFGALGLILFQGVAVIAVIFVFGELKLATYYRMYSKIPEFVSETYFFDTFRRPDISDAKILLRRQKRIAEYLGMTSIMKRNLLENTYAIYERLSTRSEYVKFSPWIDELNLGMGKDYSNYWMSLMSSRIRAANEPENADKHMLQIKNHLPAYDQAYRDVIRNSIESKNFKMLDRWCAEYKKDSNIVMTSAIPYYNYPGPNNHNNLLLSMNMDEAKIFLKYDGIVLNRMHPYEFNYPLAKSQEKLELVFRLLPGVSLTIEDIIVTNHENQSQTFSIEDLLIFANQSFFASANTILTKSPKTPEVITFIPKHGRFPPSSKIILNMKFGRLGLSNYKSCLIENTG